MPVRRPDRDADAGRPPAAGQGRRLDGRPGDAPQPRRGPAQGHPHRRPRGPPEGRRRHPRGRPAARSSARTGTEREFEMPGRLPGLRHARSSATRARSATTARNPACPARVGQEFGHFAGRGGMDIEGAGWAVLEQLLAARPGQARGRLLPARPSRSSMTLDRFARKSAENLVAAIERAAAPAARRGSSPRSASRRSASRRRSTWPPGSPSAGRRPTTSRWAAPTAGWRAAPPGRDRARSAGAVRGGAGHRADRGRQPRPLLRRPGAPAACSTTSSTPASSRAARRPRAAAAASRAAGRQDARRDGHAGGLRPPGGRGGDPGGRRQGRRARSARKTDYLVAGENAGSKLAKAQELGVRGPRRGRLPALLAGEAP